MNALGHPFQFCHLLARNCPILLASLPNLKFISNIHRLKSSGSASSVFTGYRVSTTVLSGYVQFIAFTFQDWNLNVDHNHIGILGTGASTGLEIRMNTTNDSSIGKLDRIIVFIYYLVESVTCVDRRMSPSWANLLAIGLLAVNSRMWFRVLEEWFGIAISTVFGPCNLLVVSAWLVARVGSARSPIRSFCFTSTICVGWRPLYKA